MIAKFLLSILLTSLGSIGILAANAVAQEPPECYIVDDSGELTDLTDICNVREKKSAETESSVNEAQNVNNNVNIIDSKPSKAGLSKNGSVYILGKNTLVRESELINSAYYIDNEVGLDYSAYVRTYQTSSTTKDRPTLRELAFQFDTNPSLTSILRHSTRVPFIIYRYPKK